MQKYVVFLLVYKRSKTVANSNKFRTWRSRGFSNESIKSRSLSDNSLNPGINYTDNAKI